MGGYYRLSLKTRVKPPKKFNFRYDGTALTHLNHIINVIIKKYRIVKYSKTKKSVRVLKLLDVIIPKEYFGTTRNRKLFYKITEKVLTQSSFECVHLSVLHKNFNIDAIPWLKGINSWKIRQELLLQQNLWVLNRIVKPLIAFYYKPIKTLNGNEIQFVRREKLISFETNVLNKLKRLGYLEKVEERQDIKPRGVLKIIPKRDTFRAIVALFRDPSKKQLYKKINCQVYKAAREMSNKHFPESLYDAWTTFLQKVGDENIYGIKLDIKDAYGNVDITVLTKLVSGLKPHFLDDKEKGFILHHISNQLIVFRHTIYKWNHGLLQGDRLSSCLCELYMTHQDSFLVLSIPKDQKFFHRTVDDYFFCSIYPHKVAEFEELTKSFHQVNHDKTKSNLYGTNEIPYCGKLFDLKTKQVKTLYSFTPNFEIRHRFKLWNDRHQISEKNCNMFLKTAMKFSFISNSFTKLQMNTVFNSQKTVFENFYDGMIYVAYKFDAAVMALRNNSMIENLDFVWTVLEQVVKEYSWRVYKKIKISKGKKNEIRCFTLKVLAWRAFIAVLKRRNEVYKNLIEKIRESYNLRLKCNSDVDFNYFTKLPEKFRNVIITRKLNV